VRYQELILFVTLIFDPLKKKNMGRKPLFLKSKDVFPHFILSG
jgi:hypothetical protein